MQSERGNFMAKKKVYAVKKGRQTGLFSSWSECKAVVSGFPGAEFRGFVTEEEAKNYLNTPCLKKEEVVFQKDSGEVLPENPKAITEDRQSLPYVEHLTVYVDGSFDKDIQKYSFGCIILTPDGNIFRECGNGNQPESLAIHNVAGEMLGAMQAVRWAVVNEYQTIELRYDYEGIEKWVTGVWRAKNPLVQKYAAYMKSQGRLVKIFFHKVKAHSGDYYNEQADRLAKAALYTEDGILN